MKMARWASIIGRRWLLLLLWAAGTVAHGQVRELDLTQTELPRPLSGAMSVAVVPAATAAEPDGLWALLAAQPEGWPPGRWKVRPGERVVGRIVLHGPVDPAVYVVQVPISRVDEVLVWWREPGQPWHAARAGDRVPYSQWPFVNQLPAFPVSVGAQPVELIVAVSNDAVMDVPVLIKSDGRHREDDVLQANTLGMIMGVGLMGMIVCVVSALTFRTRASWVLVAYAAWAFVMVACVSGYAGIWFTPEAPEFNDGTKHFTGVVMAGLLAAVTAEMLDQLEFWPVLRWSGTALLVLAVAYAVVQAVWLPNAWRPLGGVAWVALCFVASLMLCLVSSLRGGRHVPMVTAAVLCFGLVGVLSSVIALGAAPSGRLGVDWRSILSALLLFASAQVLRHALYRRERYGRDVLGRAALSVNRDPLTALLSYPGMQTAYDQASLRHQAGRGSVAVVLIALPALEQCAMDHGFELTERAVVRFAAALQQVLGRSWATGRLSKTRFCAVTNSGDGAMALVQTATRILSHAARVEEPLPLVGAFDLRIVCSVLPGEPPAFDEMLRALEETGQAMASSKRIALL